MADLSKITELFSNLDPGKKRSLSLLAGSILSIGILYAMVDGADTPERAPPPDPPRVGMLTGKDINMLQTDAVAQEMQRLRTEFESMRKIAEMNSRKAEESEAKARRRYEESLSKIKADFDNRINDVLASQAQVITQSQAAPSGEGGTTDKKIQNAAPPIAVMNAWQEASISNQEEGDGSGSPKQGNFNKGPVSQTGTTAPKLQAFVAEEAQEANDDAKDVSTRKRRNPGNHLSTGSLVTGVLLSGLDAPTSTQAQSEPHPVLIRVKHEAIMPNRYRSDIKECFIVGAGYGDISSERAFVRSERLSCIKTDRTPIDIPMESQALGEDGKVGIRGRLVTRNGRMLAMSMMAGFGSGLSDIFRPAAVTSLNTSPSGSTAFERPDVQDAFEAGAYSGVNKAMERISDYYLSLAENLFPIIEIDAGRPVTMMVLNGVDLDTEDTTQVSDNAYERNPPLKKASGTPSQARRTTPSNIAQR